MTVSEVCRRRGLSPSVLYRSRAVAEKGSASALKQDARKRPGKSDAEARQAAEITRLRAVIAEITAENLEMKKKGLPAIEWVKVDHFLIKVVAACK